MNNIIESRQVYMLVDRKRIKARNKAIKQIATMIYCWLFGVAMTATLLALVQLAFVVSH